MGETLGVVRYNHSKSCTQPSSSPLQQSCTVGSFTYTIRLYDQNNAYTYTNASRVDLTAHLSDCDCFGTNALSSLLRNVTARDIALRRLSQCNLLAIARLPQPVDCTQAPAIVAKGTLAWTTLLAPTASMITLCVMASTAANALPALSKPPTSKDRP